MAIDIAELKSALKEIVKEDPYFFRSLLVDIISEELLTKKEAFEKLATKEDLKMLIEMFNKRFEEINRRFEAIDKRFEDMQRYMNARFEAVDKRFEDMRYYIDKRIGFLEKLIVGFNVPILLLLLKLVLG